MFVVRLILTLVSVVRAAAAYQVYTGNGSGGAHCGGNEVRPLADGTPYGWNEGSVQDCQARCTADPRCNAFVRREDLGCYWKSGVTEDTMDLDYNGGMMHSCYLRTNGTQRSGKPTVLIWTEPSSGGKEESQGLSSGTRAEQLFRMFRSGGIPGHSLSTRAGKCPSFPLFRGLFAARGYSRLPPHLPLTTAQLPSLGIVSGATTPSLPGGQGGEGFCTRTARLYLPSIFR